MRAAPPSSAHGAAFPLLAEERLRVAVLPILARSGAAPEVAAALRARLARESAAATTAAGSGTAAADAPAEAADDEAAIVLDEAHEARHLPRGSAARATGARASEDGELIAAAIAASSERLVWQLRRRGFEVLLCERAPDAKKALAVSASSLHPRRQCPAADFWR